MNREKKLEIAILVTCFIFCLVFACAMHGSNRPGITITSVLPTCIDATGNPPTLVVNGYGFTGRSLVYVNGISRATTYISNTQLTAQLAPIDVSTTQTLTVFVYNDKPRPSHSNNWTVSAIVPTLKIFTNSLPDGEVGNPYSVQLDAGYVSGCTGARLQ